MLEKLKHLGLPDAIFLILLGTLAALIISVSVMAWYPYNPLRVDEFYIDKSEVCQGEKVCFRVLGEKFYAKPVKVTVELVNGEGYFMVSYGANNPVGTSFPPRCFSIPYHVTPDLYRIRWTGVYEMNAFNYVTVVVYSKWLRVYLGGLESRRGEQGPRGKKGAKGDKGDRGGIKLW
jgi:hypothetical protein